MLRKSTPVYQASHQHTNPKEHRQVTLLARVLRVKYFTSRGQQPSLTNKRLAITSSH
jgi:hypothetical protein